jgi:two-component system response regulator MprA
VRALLRRREPAVGESLRFLDLSLHTGTRTAHRGSREISLSTTEFELLHYFVRHPRRVLSREAILNAVWSAQFDHPTNVVEVYIGYLRAKLEAADESRLIHTVRGAGYVLKEA